MLHVMQLQTTPQFHTWHECPVRGCRKQLKNGGRVEYIIRTDLYGEKLQSYGVTEKVGGGGGGGGLQPTLIPWFLHL